MRNLRLAFVAAAALSLGTAARAQEGGDLGLGLILGDPIGATAKYMITGRQAVQTTLGVSEHLTWTADYVWHGFELTPQPKHGPLAVYLAGGIRLEDQEDVDVGFRTMVGLSYWPKFKSRTAEFFVELGPCYRLANKYDDFRIRVDGGFGLRVYFSPRSSKDS